ncbi:hypothetical protein PTKIN_Ptkin14bG0007800 [Pterospermum kingtungense]
MSENSAFQEEVQICVRSNDMDEADDIEKQDPIDDKDDSVTPSGLKEIDRDVQMLKQWSGYKFHERKRKKTPWINKQTVSEKILVQKLENENFETVQTEDKQRRKRQRTIMNDEQVIIMERALLDEREMQRNSASVQLGADKLSSCT